LRDLKRGGNYGVLVLLKRAGDVAFAVCPVPDLKDYEIVCASPNRLYDIWKDGHIVKTDMTRRQVKSWIKNNTPKWLYDDSEVTDEHRSLVRSWVCEVLDRYPGLDIFG
jgi:hypothetical protein